MLNQKQKNMKEKLVKTIKGIECKEKECRLIDGEYYLIGNNKVENSGDIYLINNRYIRFSTERIVFDHFEQEYKLKNSSLINGIIGIKDGEPIFGYFTRNDFYNVRVILKDLSEKVAIAYNVLGYAFREKRSDGVFYHISIIEANKFNQIRAVSREVKESFPYDSKGSIEKITRTFQNYYKPVISKNANLIGESLKDYTFGLEFETSVGIIPNSKINFLPLIPLRDGSIGGIEYATIPLKGPIGVQALVDSVDELKRRTAFNDDCSLHVHIGGMPRTVEFILAFYKTISLLQNDIFSLFPVYKKYNFGVKRKNYSAPFPFEEINFKMDPVINYTDKKALIKNFEPLFIYLSGGMSFAEYGSDLSKVVNHPQDPQGNAKWNIKHRYSFVNLIPLIFGNHQTIEFRIHTPTYNINKIVNFLMINTYIIDYVKLNYKQILAGVDALALRRPTLNTLIESYVNNIPENGRRMIHSELIHYVSDRRHLNENLTREKGIVYQEEDLRINRTIRLNTYQYHKKVYSEETSWSEGLYDSSNEGSPFSWSYGLDPIRTDSPEESFRKLKAQADAQSALKRSISRKEVKMRSASSSKSIYEQMKEDFLSVDAPVSTTNIVPPYPASPAQSKGFVAFNEQPSIQSSAIKRAEEYLEAAKKDLAQVEQAKFDNAWPSFRFEHEDKKEDK